MRAELPFRDIQTGQANGLTGTLQKIFLKDKCKVLKLGRKNLLQWFFFQRVKPCTSSTGNSQTDIGVFLPFQTVLSQFIWRSGEGQLYDITLCFLASLPTLGVLAPIPGQSSVLLSCCLGDLWQKQIVLFFFPALCHLICSFYVIAVSRQSHLAVTVSRRLSAGATCFEWVEGVLGFIQLGQSLIPGSYLFSVIQGRITSYLSRSLQYQRNEGR